MANDTNLRQATAKANTVGWVEQKDLQFYKVVNDEDKECNSEDEADGIKGSITVKISDTDSVRYDVKVAKKTKAGTDNKAYAGIRTVKETYKSIKDFGLEEADKVHVSGDFNMYANINSGEEVIRYKSNFFNRINISAEEEFTPKAEFEIEMFIKSLIEEVDKEGEATGRLKVTGWVPVYGGIEPVTLIAPDNIAGAVDSSFNPGQTVTFYGDIINSKVVKITEIPVVIGKPKTKTETTYKNELIITGASEAYEEDVTPEKPYDENVIKAAIAERDAKIAERKAKQSQSTNKTKPSGAAKGRTLGF